MWKSILSDSSSLFPGSMTKILLESPTCGAASPTPGATYIVSVILFNRLVRLSPNSLSSTDLAILDKIGCGASRIGSTVMESPNQKEKKYDLFFIGHHEPDYEKYISEIIDRDINFFLGGPGWNSSNIPKSKIAFNDFNEKIYPEVINKSSAGLGLYSTWNRNISSGRIFEIPATGAALIVKRNTFIESLYKEDSEAIFFDNPVELRLKIDDLFKNRDLLQEIASNGYQRCLSNQCTWDDRVKEAIDFLIIEKII